MAGHFYSEVVDSHFQPVGVDIYAVSLQRRLTHTIEESAERLIEKGNWGDFDVFFRAVVQNAIPFVVLILLTLLWFCQPRWRTVKIHGFRKKILEVGEVARLGLNDFPRMLSSAPSRGRVRELN